MRTAAASLVGEHDFAAFQASGSSVQSTVRRVLAVDWLERGGDWRLFRITANGFLRGMVRALVGTLVEIGRGKRPPESLPALLEARDRRLAGPTAPARGLYLVQVIYAAEEYAALGGGSGIPLTPVLP
jgi:tRNA pseudouridine38-40 synthase